MTDFQDMMQKATELGSRIKKLQEDAAARTVEATAGGGMVTVVMNGKQEVLSVRIEKEVVSPDDVRLLEDLVRAAVNEAIVRSREVLAQEMSRITGDLGIPGLP